MIFFDIDGTLIDFKQAEAAGIRTFYQTYGHHFTLTEEAFHVEWRVVGARHFSRFLRGELSFEQQQAERVKSLFELAAIRLTDREAGAYFGTYIRAFESSWQPMTMWSPVCSSFKRWVTGWALSATGTARSSGASWNGQGC